MDIGGRLRAQSRGLECRSKQKEERKKKSSIGGSTGDEGKPITAKALGSGESGDFEGVYSVNRTQWARVAQSISPPALEVIRPEAVPHEPQGGPSHSQVNISLLDQLSDLSVLFTSHQTHLILLYQQTATASRKLLGQRPLSPSSCLVTQENI